MSSDIGVIKTLYSHGGKHPARNIKETFLTITIGPPHPTSKSGAVAERRHPSNTVGTGAAVRGCPTSKGKGEAPADGRRGKLVFKSNPIPAEMLRRLKQTLCAPGPGGPTETETEVGVSVSCGGSGWRWSPAGTGALGVGVA